MSAVAALQSPESNRAGRYARSVALSKISEWQIDRDLLRGRSYGILQAQAAADADYFIRNVSRPFTDEELGSIKAVVLSAYRWQYIISGVPHPHFGRLLAGMTTPTQMAQIQTALAPIMNGE